MPRFLSWLTRILLIIILKAKAMKNLTSKLNLFVSLFFLTALSPLLLKSSDAMAQTASCAKTSGPGTCDLNPAKNGCVASTVDTVCSFTGSLKATADDNAFTRTLCNALRIITGTGGKAFAAFAIISLGIGFFTGKVSWGLMVGVTAGIAAMFGAPTIVAAISGSTAATCTSGAIID